MTELTHFRRLGRGTIAASALLLLPGVAGAQDGGKDEALAILKSMSDYLAGLTSLHVTTDSDIEVITPMLEKIQFASSGDVVMARPGKVRITRQGGYADMMLTYDGKTVLLADVAGKRHATMALEGSVTDLVDATHAMPGAGMPGADLLLPDVFARLSADVIEAKHVGVGVVGGTECEHLAFRNADTDWQLWVRTGDAPAPCKLVITSKAVAGAPQYTLTVRSFEANAAVSDDQFATAAPDGSTEVKLPDLGNLDEIPPATP